MTTAATATDRSTLPQWKGHPVPWATRWTGEVVQTPAAMSIERATMHVHLRYEDGLEDRDSHGVLWKREGIGRQGEPQFADLNTYRQRASMNKRLCQICGTKIDERPIRWLLGQDQLIDLEDGDFATISPPTCSACIPLALELCPHLKRKGYAILKVLDYEPWGVMGQAVVVDLENERWRDVRGSFVSYKDPKLPLTSIVAYQQCVRLTKFIFEKGFDQ
jgi:hypothetical protein